MITPPSRRQHELGSLDRSRVGTTGISEPEAIKKYGKENVKAYHTKFSAMFLDVFPPAAYRPARKP
jgi:hypothetical protein